MNFIQVKNKRVNFDRVDFYEPVGEDSILICYNGVDRIFKFENQEERDIGIAVLDNSTSRQLIV